MQMAGSFGRTRRNNDEKSKLRIPTYLHTLEHILLPTAHLLEADKLAADQPDGGILGHGDAEIMTKNQNNKFSHTCTHSSIFCCLQHISLKQTSCPQTRQMAGSLGTETQLEHCFLRKCWKMLSYSLGSNTSFGEKYSGNTSSKF